MATSLVKVAVIAVCSSAGVAVAAAPYIVIWLGDMNTAVENASITIGRHNGELRDLQERIEKIERKL